MAKLIHGNSNIATLGICDLWEVPPTQISISKSSTILIQPDAPLSSGGPISFELRTTDDQYLRLDESYIHIKYTVRLGESGSNASLANWNKISRCQYFMHSMFKNVSLSINDTLVTQSSDTYPYRAWFECFFGFSEEAKLTHLPNAGWSSTTSGTNDTGKYTDKLHPTLIENAGTEEATHEMMGRLHLDMFMQGKALIPNSKIVIKLYPHEANFFLFRTPATPDTKEPSIKFNSVVFEAHISKATPALLDSHSKPLMSDNALYPINRIEVKTASIGTGLIDYNIPNLHVGVLPSRIFLALIENVAFNGSWDKDPFAFAPHNLTRLCGVVNGIDHYPSQPLEGQGIKEYMMVLKGLNQNSFNTNIKYTFSDFKSKPIYCIPLDPDTTSGAGEITHVNLKRGGNLSIHLNFKAANTTPLTLVTWLEFENVLEITKNGDVIASWNL